jgi:hypothetical protein
LEGARLFGGLFLWTHDRCNTRIVSVKRVTVTLDEETAMWTRSEAARRDVSVSGLIRQLLTDHMGGQNAYAGAKGRYLSRQPSKLSKRGSQYPGREKLHDRTGLR